jgi:uncharacterized protein YecE (DUF72 family)
MGWSYNFWKKNFYPANLPSEQFLTYYSKKFDTVEVDSTFYRIPRHTTVLDWGKQTPNGFTFSLKFPQVISHIKKLKNCQEESKVFIERAELLREKLGVLLLQLPNSFSSNADILSLGDFVQTLPEGLRYAVEIRNKKILNEHLYSVLRNKNIALVWAESPLMPLSGETTADFVYVRWEGDRKIVNGTLGKREVEKLSNIKAWAERLRQISAEAFGYFSKYYTGHPPSDVEDLLRNLKVEKSQI